MTAMDKMTSFLPKRHKFGAKKQVHPEWGKFDSLGEMRHYQFLYNLQNNKIITNLERQIRYDIVVSGKKVCWIKPDYQYMVDGKLVISDFKGLITPEAKLKFKLFRIVSGHEILIIKKPGERYI